MSFAKAGMIRALSAIAMAGALLTFPALAESLSLKIGVDKKMNAELLLPDGAGPFPLVLVLHTSGGLQPGDGAFAKEMVQEGYAALIPAFMDAYGIRAETRAQSFTADADAIYADLLAAIELLRQNPQIDGKRVAAAGFSNGGYFALWLAATGKIQAGVSCYGAITGAGTDRELTRYRSTFTTASAPVLILHGTDDATVPFNKAVELDGILNGVQAPHEFYRYAGAGHRFERDGGGNNEAAAADAWQRTQAFLARVLKAGP